MVADDPVHGWHMQALKPWDEIGAGTKLYAAPVANAGQARISDDDLDGDLRSDAEVYDHEAQAAQPAGDEQSLFEAWMAEDGWPSLSKRESGAYAHGGVQAKHRAWMARAAIAAQQPAQPVDVIEAAKQAGLREQRGSVWMAIGGEKELRDFAKILLGQKP